MHVSDFGIATAPVTLKPPPGLSLTIADQQTCTTVPDRSCPSGLAQRCVGGIAGTTQSCIAGPRPVVDSSSGAAASPAISSAGPVLPPGVKPAGSPILLYAGLAVAAYFLLRR